MCQQCLDACREVYPDLPESDYHHLLMGATAFPFGGPETVRKQLIEARAATDGSLEQALGFADAQMTEAATVSLGQDQ